METNPVHVDAGGLMLCDPTRPWSPDAKRVAPQHASLATCRRCRVLSGAEPMIHLTTDAGFTVACMAGKPRAQISPVPSIVDMESHELISCSKCAIIALEQARQAQAQESTPAALERIATALERIATVAEAYSDPHHLTDLLTLALSRSR